MCAGAAHHRHQQVFDAGVQAERRRVHRALHVRIEPAGEGGQHGGVDEGQLRARGVFDPELAAASAPPRSARMARPARLSSRLRGGQRGQHHADPDHGEIEPPVDQLEAAERQRRDAGDAVVAAEQVEIGESVVKAHRPGDGAERQVMAGQPQRDRADRQRRHAR